MAGASDLTVGMTGREMYLTHESASFEWKETMKMIHGDIEDRVFMMKIPQTETRMPAVFRNEKYLTLLGIDIHPPSAFVPMFNYTPGNNSPNRGKDPKDKKKTARPPPPPCGRNRQISPDAAGLMQMAQTAVEYIKNTFTDLSMLPDDALKLIPIQGVNEAKLNAVTLDKLSLDRLSFITIDQLFIDTGKTDVGAWGMDDIILEEADADTTLGKHTLDQVLPEKLQEVDLADLSSVYRVQIFAISLDTEVLKGWTFDDLSADALKNVKVPKPPPPPPAGESLKVL
jgi:hypothetical protein